MVTDVTKVMGISIIRILANATEDRESRETWDCLCACIVARYLL